MLDFFLTQNELIKLIEKIEHVINQVMIYFFNQVKLTHKEMISFSATMLPSMLSFDKFRHSRTTRLF